MCNTLCTVCSGCVTWCALYVIHSITYSVVSVIHGRSCVLCVYDARYVVCAGSGYKGHVEVLAPAVQELAALEKRAQSSFLNLMYNKPFTSSRH